MQTMQKKVEAFDANLKKIKALLATYHRERKAADEAPLAIDRMAHFKKVSAAVAELVELTAPIVGMNEAVCRMVRMNYVQQRKWIGTLTELLKKAKK